MKNLLFANALQNALRRVRSAFPILGVFVALALALFFGLWIGRYAPVTRSWTLADLRLLDVSFTPDPATDITAIYTRQAGLHCEIRFDYLDLPETPLYDIQIAVNERIANFKDDQKLPSGSKLDYDPVTDTILINLDDCSPEADAALLVQTRAEEFATTFGVRADIQPVGLQFVFYNTFSPAATPAQALRRWDGAHTGPRGERHGLHGLLDAAEKYGVPLTLLDVKTPTALSAIDVAGGMVQLWRMEQNRLLEMPLVIYGQPQAVSLALSIAATKNFGLSKWGNYDANYPPISAPFRWQNPALNHAGLPLEIRQELLQMAVMGDIPRMVGGDFQRSTWGTYEYASASFAYMAARPYIQFVKAYALGASLIEPAQIPENPVAASALETQAMLGASDAGLAKNYAGLVSVMETAAMWTENPAPLAECTELCILASDKFYAVLNPLGGRLAFFFAGKDQIVGPTAQFFIGLSDQSQWDLSKGEGADPAQIMGAFADVDNAFRPYQAEVLDKNTIRFVAEDGREKIYRLTENGLEVVLSGPMETKIPLVVAPQTRFESGWAEKYRLAREVDGIRFGVADGPMVRIQVKGGQVLAADSFIDAIPLLAFPEDPNAENPSGFYLPFPMTIVSVSGSDLFVKLYVTK